MKLQKPLSLQPIPPHAKKVHTGPVFEVHQWEQELYNGKVVTFEKVKRSDTVIVFPVLPNGNILLSRQKQPLKPVFIGGFGGRIESGEDVITAAKRELLEESGYTAKELILWRAEQPISKVEWAVYVFVAHGVEKIFQEQNLDGGEKIEMFEVSFDEFLEIAQRDDFEEKEIYRDIMQAVTNPEKMKKLRKLFRQ